MEPNKNTKNTKHIYKLKNTWVELDQPRKNEKKKKKKKSVIIEYFL